MLRQLISDKINNLSSKSAFIPCTAHWCIKLIKCQFGGTKTGQFKTENILRERKALYILKIPEYLLLNIKDTLQINMKKARKNILH